LPGAAERREYHGRQAALAERAGQSFAAAFHLGRLLLDAPGDPDLTRRRAEAMGQHGRAGPPAPAPVPIAE
jgi:hypothetical protein